MGRHPKAGNSGYEAGQGRTFTPSAGAEWTEDFNSIMTSLNKSRNEMTEDLIRDGLMARKGKQTGLSTYYNDAEIDFLKNPIMQKLVKDYYLLMHGSAPTILQDHLDKPSSVTPVLIEKSKVVPDTNAVEPSSFPSAVPVVEPVPKVTHQQSETQQSLEQENDNDEMDALKQARAMLSKMALKKTNQ